MHHFIKKQIATTLLCALAFSQLTTQNQPSQQVKAESNISASTTENSTKLFTTHTEQMNCYATKYLSLQEQYAITNITFSSSDINTVWVGDDGQIIALEPGTATITATTKDGKTDQCQITVTNTYEEEIYTEETTKVAISYHYGYPLSLKEGWKATDCTFKSQDETIVQVSKEGVIFGVTSGCTNIEVTHKNGESFTCQVTVYEDNKFTSTKEMYNVSAIITGASDCDRVCEPDRLKEVYIPRYAYTSDAANNGFRVTKIQDHAFEGQTQIEKVVFPEGIKLIQEQAFKDCTSLKTAIFLGKETEIADDAFVGTQVIFIGYKGSTAEQYAITHENITFKEISEDRENSVVKEEISLVQIVRSVSFLPEEYRKEEEPKAKLVKGAYTISDGQYTLREGTKRPWIPFVAGSQYTTEDITYSISDKNVVSIENGNLIAKEAGKTVVTLSLPNGIKRTINVVVEEKKNTSISQNESKEPSTDTKSETEETTKKNNKKTVLTWKAKKQSIKVGKTFTFKVKVKNSQKAVTWTVSNKKIASIKTKTGKFKAKKAGKVTVTAKCNGVKKSCVVKVKR